MWLITFWALEGLRRSYVRKNREARDTRDLSNPRTPTTEPGPTCYVEHKTSHGGCIQTDTRVAVHRGEMVIQPILGKNGVTVVDYKYLMSGHVVSFAKQDLTSHCGHCGTPYTTERRCENCGAPTWRSDVEFRK